MPSQFFGLNIAASALNAFQASVNTAANNVSNVQTKGYSKQVTNKEVSIVLPAAPSGRRHAPPPEKRYPSGVQKVYYSKPV